MKKITKKQVISTMIVVIIVFSACSLISHFNAPAKEKTNTTTVDKENNIYRDLDASERIDASSEYPCSGNPLPTNTYTDTKWNYTLEIPASYLTQKEENVLLINEFKCHDYSKGPPPPILEIRVAKQTPSETHMKAMQYVKSKYSDGNTTAINPITINGLSGAEVSWNYEGEESYALYKSVILIHNSIVYTLEYNPGKKDYEKIIGSFKVME